MIYKVRQLRSVRLLSVEELESRLCLSGVSFTSHMIVAGEANHPTLVFPADVDSDGDVDVLSVSKDVEGKIAWYENTDGEGSFGQQQVITTQSGLNSAYVTDIDGDGDVDVISAWTAWNDRENKFESGLGWYENTDKAGTFGPQQMITADEDWVKYAADLDGDGDIDVISANSEWDGVDTFSVDTFWYENTDGKGHFGPRKLIGTEPEGGTVSAADVDRDGDLDVVLAFGYEGWWCECGGVTWYENTDGAGSFGHRRYIITGPDVDSALSIVTTDLDGDGDIDVLSSVDSEVAWHENADGNGTFSLQKIISSDVYRATVHAVDVDGDGDEDVLASNTAPSTGFNTGTIAWYENTDGQGNFGEQQVITKLGDARHFFAPFWILHGVDVDGDGDADVLAAWSDGRGYTIAWYENHLAGDADDNGEVQLADYLTLAANFENTDAEWEDGDFDGDGKVAFGDFLILANNFGKSRPQPQPVASEAAWQPDAAVSPLITTAGSNVDELHKSSRQIKVDLRAADAVFAEMGG